MHLFFYFPTLGKEKKKLISLKKTKYYLHNKRDFHIPPIQKLRVVPMACPHYFVCNIHSYSKPLPKNLATKEDKHDRTLDTQENYTACPSLALQDICELLEPMRIKMQTVMTGGRPRYFTCIF